MMCKKHGVFWLVVNKYMNDYMVGGGGFIK